MNTIDAIAKAKFLATDAQVRNLAVTAAEGHNASNVYFRVLLAFVVNSLTTGRKRPKRVTKAVQLNAINAEHDRLYPLVLEGVREKFKDADASTVDDLANYARSSASDLRYFVKESGDLRTLDPATVRKSDLRAIGKDVPTGTRFERAVAKSTATLLRGCERIAREDPKEATKRLRAAAKDIGKLLTKIEKGSIPVVEKKVAAKKPAVDKKPAVKIISTNLTRVPPRPTATPELRV